MIVVLTAITAWLTLMTAALVLVKTFMQDKVLGEQSTDLKKIASSVNGGLEQVRLQAEEMRERCDRTEQYAAEMDRYATRTKEALRIIDAAVKAGEQVVKIHEVVGSQLVQDRLLATPPPPVAGEQEETH